VLASSPELTATQEDTMWRGTRTHKILAGRALAVSVAAAALAAPAAALGGSNAQQAPASGPTLIAPSPEELQEAARKRGVGDAATLPQPALQRGAKASHESSPPAAAESGGSSAPWAIVGGAVGAALGCILVAFALLAGRRRGHPVGT